SLLSNTTGFDNTAVGLSSLRFNSNGTNNTAAGVSALRNNTSGTYNTAVGRDALSNITTGSNNTGIGRGAQVPNATGNNQVRVGNAAVSYAGIQVAWSVTSDRRWKSNILPANLGLTFISQLKPVSYTRNNDESGKLEFGFIA